MPIEAGLGAILVESSISNGKASILRCPGIKMTTNAKLMRHKFAGLGASLLSHCG